MSMEADDMFNKVLEEMVDARRSLAVNEERERTANASLRETVATSDRLRRELADANAKIKAIGEAQSAGQPKLAELYAASEVFTKNNASVTVGDISRLIKAREAAAKICTDDEIPF